MEKEEEQMERVTIKDIARMCGVGVSTVSRAMGSVKKQGQKIYLEKEEEQMERVTIKDIARMCGVGVSTVSRAMNNHPDINPETKRMIMETIRLHNYIPNNSARNLKRTASKEIAVLVKGISNPLFLRMIKVFEEEIQKEKYSLVLQHVDEWQDEVDEAIKLEKEKRLRGIVFLGGQFTHSIDKLDQMSVPFVLSTIDLASEEGKKRYATVSVDDKKESGKVVDYLISKGHKKIASVPFVLSTIDLASEEGKKRYATVSVDDKKESGKVVDYLISKGHKKIAIITSTKEDESIGKLRLEGYYESLEKHGIKIDPSLVKYMRPELGSYTMENGYDLTKELLEEKADFTALYVISDRMAIGACKAIFDSGKNVPEDYSVVGFDGLEMAQFYNPSITTLRQPMEEMAKATIHMLFEMIRKKSGRQRMLFEGELMEAQSVREIH